MYLSSFIVVFAVAVLLGGGVKSSLFTDTLSDEFEKTFVRKCSKYSIVKSWVNMLERSTTSSSNEDAKSITFVYQEGGVKNGGLGDRLAGLVSAVTIAALYNRTLLIKSDDDYLSKLFRPYHPEDIRSPTPRYTWVRSAQRRNRNSEFSADCLNTDNSKCTLISGDVDETNVNYVSNRAFLCYYAMNQTSAAGKRLVEMGINEATDLFEVAGCMLRLALWPTDYLWQELEQVYFRFGARVVSRRPRAANSTIIPRYQMGLHFRCGDRAFEENNNQEACKFSDRNYRSHSFEKGNPVGIAKCAKDSYDKLLKQRGAENDTQARTDIAFLTSDSIVSAHQMSRLLAHPHTLVSPASCHIETDPRPGCHTFTVAYWLAMSLSDVLVTQTQDNGGPASAFSRSAGIYGLKDDPFRDGRSRCAFKTNHQLGRLENGNWHCLPIRRSPMPRAHRLNTTKRVSS